MLNQVKVELDYSLAQSPITGLSVPLKVLVNKESASTNCILEPARRLGLTCPFRLIKYSIIATSEQMKNC